MLESALNLDTNISEVKGKQIVVILDVIIEILGLSNSGKRRIIRSHVQIMIENLDFPEDGMGS